MPIILTYTGTKTFEDLSLPINAAERLNVAWTTDATLVPTSSSGGTLTFGAEQLVSSTSTTGATYTMGGMGLYYFGRRYYDPEIGVWTATDPDEQFYNAYGYTLLSAHQKYATCLI